MLNDSTDGHMSQYGELNHIFCVDDLKTFAKDWWPAAGSPHHREDIQQPSDIKMEYGLEKVC